VEETVAIVVAFEVHVTVRPVNGLPCASVSATESCCVLPATTLADDGVTTTLATGAAVTVTSAPPVCPSLDAEIVAVPIDTPETTPLFDTVATAVLVDVHATARPVSVCPCASRSVAVACDVPTAVIVVGFNETVTDATGAGVTVMLDVPVFPSLVAVIVAVPVATPVTRPVVDTVAVERALEVHVTVRPVSVVPRESLTVAVSCCVKPAAILAVVGATVTLATGAGPIVSGALPV
jgi:hypothetical protein